MNNEAIQKILENRPAMIAIMLCATATAVVSIVIGFRVIYQLITFIGA